jgi:hypothetical protein
MTAILIGAGLSGVVLGATNRLVFLLPAALIALAVAAVLIVRADIDLGFTALAATLLNGGFLLGIVVAHVLPGLSVSPPWWRVDETDAGFIVRDHGDRPLARVGFDGRPEADSLLTRDEAREIAASLGKRPELVGGGSTSLAFQPDKPWRVSQSPGEYAVPVHVVVASEG